VKYANERAEHSGERYTEFLEFVLASSICGHIEEENAKFEIVIKCFNDYDLKLMEEL